PGIAAPRGTGAGPPSSVPAVAGAPGASGSSTEAPLPPTAPPASPAPPARDPASRLAPPAPPLAGQARPPEPLRPAWLHGDRALILYVECQPDGVVLHPSRQRFAAESLNHSPAHNPLYKAVRQQIARRQPTVPPRAEPYRPH